METELMFLDCPAYWTAAGSVWLGPNRCRSGTADVSTPYAGRGGDAPGGVLWSACAPGPAAGLRTSERPQAHSSRRIPA